LRKITHSLLPLTEQLEVSTDLCPYLKQTLIVMGLNGVHYA